MPKHNVVIGPRRLALRYARRRGWLPEDVIVVTSHHELHMIDPPLIKRIIVLGRRVIGAMLHEIQALRRLWPIRVVQVPAPA